MAGSKRQKVKKMAAPLLPSPPPPADEDDALVDDLLAQLDSPDKDVQSQAAVVLQDVQESELEAAKANGKQTKNGGSRSRFDARQVRLR